MLILGKSSKVSYAVLETTLAIYPSIHSKHILWRGIASYLLVYTTTSLELLMTTRAGHAEAQPAAPAPFKPCQGKANAEKAEGVQRLGNTLRSPLPRPTRAAFSWNRLGQRGDSAYRSLGHLLVQGRHFPSRHFKLSEYCNTRKHPCCFFSPVSCQQGRGRC